MSPTHLGEQDASSAHRAAFIETQKSPEFQELRSRLRRFVFPMTAFFLVWYAIYVLLGAFAHDFMATKVIGQHQRRLGDRARAVRDDVPHHRSLRAVRQPGTRPARRGHPHRAGK